MRLALLLLVVLAGCRAGQAPPAPPASAAPETPSPDTAATAAEAEQEVPDYLDGETGCFLVAEDTVAAFSRPSAEAGRFGTLLPGDSVYVGARAENGWAGFAPGTAQAANVGPFRLRYVAPEAAVRLVGAGCAALPTVPALPPHTCFEMAMAAAAVYAAPDTASAVVATIPAQGYAEVVRRTPDGWAQVRFADRLGWIAPSDANYNGDCDAVTGR